MEFCRENDVALTHSFADAPKDMRIPRERFENLRLTEHRSDGIVVHGVKSVATLAPFADEYVALAPNRPGLADDEIVYFAVPMDTPGLRVFCRPSLVPPSVPDRRLAAAFDEMDCWVVFDNVFVPAERVFYRQATHVHLGLLGPDPAVGLLPHPHQDDLQGRGAGRHLRPGHRVPGQGQPAAPPASVVRDVRLRGDAAGVPHRGRGAACAHPPTGT